MHNQDLHNRNSTLSWPLILKFPPASLSLSPVSDVEYFSSHDVEELRLRSRTDRL